MRSNKQIRISNLLRMAELCSSDDEERKRMYMDELDNLLFTDEDIENSNEVFIVEEKYNHLIDFFGKYKKLMNNHRASENYNLYVRYCNNVGIEPLAKLPFSKAMTSHFPLHSAISHVGVGETRKSVRIWILDEEGEKK